MERSTSISPTTPVQLRQFSVVDMFLDGRFQEQDIGVGGFIDEQALVRAERAQAESMVYDPNNVAHRLASARANAARRTNALSATRSEPRMVSLRANRMSSRPVSAAHTRVRARLSSTTPRPATASPLVPTAHADSSTHVPRSPITASHADRIRVRRAVAEEIKTKTDALNALLPKCCVCLTLPRDHVIEPCCHFVMCGACGKLVNRCPVCRRGITELKRIYIA